ncbi:mersacidin/lichenicidin family type 2 lantibiotic [Polymorphospora sp. NPDC050346]|uniref:mersacidin/lichenicidin family type 2 lantibiotic n=1 Tax=Polymorphospora sp. NPDC050346 TaxID=3155780 RepID=UPI0033E8AA59
MTRLTQAWKDPGYRATLSLAELAGLESNPAGVIDIDDKSLDGVVGGTYTPTQVLYPSCRTCLTCGQSTCHTCFTCSGWPC